MYKAFKFILVGLLCTCMQLANAKDGIVYKTESGIHFVNGGIGEEQATDVRRMANNFSLHLLFSEGSYGGWLTDVSVLIIDSNGKTAFTKKRAGPLLYIDLPAGDYQVVGSYQNQKESVRISLTGEKPQKVILNWKDESEVLEDSAEQESMSESN
jgi:hypothetical protein